MNEENKKFYDQIKEDIKLIQRDYGYLDDNIAKEEFAFNYWILSRLYNMDEDVILAESCITDYNDKGIDCFVHYPETKELFIIQNKFYNPDSNLIAKEVSDFLVRPLANLIDNDYKRSEDLQKLFNKASIDPEYKIFLHFYTTSERKSSDIEKVLKKFTPDNKIKACVFPPKVYCLASIKEIYYGTRFTNKCSFTGKLETRVKGTFLRILPNEKEYNLPWMHPAWFILVNVVDLYSLYTGALEKNYTLFEENVREFLGVHGINAGIIETLRSEKDRENFFYYNNGITLICEECDFNVGNTTKNSGNNILFTLKNPQVVNGCQTMNSINEVLSGDGDLNELREKYKKSYVLVKIYEFNKNDKKDKIKKLYDNIVMYTNSQNSVREKDFASKRNYFLDLQKEFERRGVLLLVKPSDKEMFRNLYKNKAEFGKLKKKYKDNFPLFKTDEGGLDSYMIPLEKMLKVLFAFKKDAWYAYTKGKSLLTRDSSDNSYYQSFSLKIGDFLNHNNMIGLYLFYRKIESDQKNLIKTGNNSNSITQEVIPPYYVIDFLGRKLIDPLTRDEKLKKLFNNEELFENIRTFYCRMVDKYVITMKDVDKIGYNQMIKTPIKEELYRTLYTDGFYYYRANKEVREFLGEF